ncbi:MAG: TetR/AcrR family transcriptional regulator, partial [Mycobacteriales bacterium]
SMRRVAQELDVGTMSLYWHVADREELLDLVFDRVVELQVLDEVPGDWRTALARIARGALRLYEQNPWILDVGPRPTVGVVVLQHVEQSIAATLSTGLSFEDRMAAVSVLDDYVLGYVLRRHVRPAGDGPPLLSETARERLDAGDFPLYAEVADDAAAHQDYGSAQAFERGLVLILDGIAVAVESGRMGGEPTAPVRHRGRRKT